MLSSSPLPWILKLSRCIEQMSSNLIQNKREKKKNILYRFALEFKCQSKDEVHDHEKICTCGVNTYISIIGGHINHTVLYKNHITERINKIQLKHSWFWKECDLCLNIKRKMCTEKVFWLHVQCLLSVTWCKRFPLIKFLNYI